MGAPLSRVDLATMPRIVRYAVKNVANRTSNGLTSPLANNANATTIGVRSKSVSDSESSSSLAAARRRIRLIPLDTNRRFEKRFSGSSYFA